MISRAVIGLKNVVNPFQFRDVPAYRDIHTVIQNPLYGTSIMMMLLRKEKNVCAPSVANP